MVSRLTHKEVFGIFIVVLVIEFFIDFFNCSNYICLLNSVSKFIVIFFVSSSFLLIIWKEFYIRVLIKKKTRFFKVYKYFLAPNFKSSKERRLNKIAIVFWVLIAIGLLLLYLNSL